ncbi:MAG TPA: dihydrofolate reductase [Flavitalea sp.]|nr:dihydrofolate reductase [Flavitalea sp.]
MIINLVVAAADNNVIGKDNRLLWHLPNDMAFFKNVTWGLPVIMGRKTFESLGKALKGRTNIVITSNNHFAAKDVIVANSIDNAVKEAQKTDAKECNVIGGGEIYKLALPVANRIYMTRVHTNLQGDTFFPAMNEKEWQQVSTTSFKVDKKHAYPYSFEIWQRK